MPGPGTGLIPHLVCSPAAKAMDFYKAAFGAEEVSRHPAQDGKRLMHAEMQIGPSSLFLADDFPEMCGGKSRTVAALGGVPTMVIHQNVKDCDAAIKRAEKAGAKVNMPAADMFWGDRYGQVTDPYGYIWSFSTPLKK